MFKSKKALVALIILLLIVAVAGWTAYYLKNPPAPKSDTPPVLKLTSSEGSKFQGLVTSPGSLLFETVSPGDSKYVLLASQQAKFAGFGTPGISSSITGGAAYYYAPIDLTAHEILSLILGSNSTPGNVFLIAYYDRSTNKYKINPPSGEDELQSFIFQEAGVADLSDDFVIKKFHPFVIYAKFPTDCPNFIYSTNVSLDTAMDAPGVAAVSMQDLVDSSAPAPGWYIIPIRKDIAVDTFLDPIKNYVVGYYPQSNNQAFGNICHVGGTCSGISSSYNFIWLDIGTPTAGIDAVTPGATGTTPPVISFCDGKNCTSCKGATCNLACNNALCKTNKIDFTKDDMFQLACITQPLLCDEHDIHIKPGIGDYGDYFDMKFRDPGWIDPVPFETEIKNLISDPFVAGSLVGVNTDPLRNKLPVSGRNDLVVDLSKNIDSQTAVTLANEVMSNDFAHALQQSSDLQNAYDMITAFEAENNVKVSDQEVAGFLGAALEQALSESFTETMNDSETLEVAVAQVLSTDTALKSSFKSTVNSTFGSLNSTFNASGLQFNVSSGAFTDLSFATGAGGVSIPGGAGGMSIPGGK